MRRYLQIAFTFWFAISMTMVEACTSAAQTTPYDPAANPPSYNARDGGYSNSGPGAGGAYDNGASADPADSHPDETGDTPDHSESQALTEYLTQHKLPLVGAQVLRKPDGSRIVMLYGFVGTDFGKSDAVAKARRFLGDSNVQVDNRINVRPELLASNPPAGNSAYAPNPGGSSGSGGANSPESSANTPDDSSSYPNAQNYMDRRNQMSQQNGLASMMPLIALLGVLGMSVAGGNSGFSFGSGPPGSSPFGASPYGGSPFGSPYGSPYSPYGRSPYGSSPYGSSPYGGPGAYPGPYSGPGAYPGPYSGPGSYPGP